MADCLGCYILGDDGNPVRCDDLMQWALWMETHDRHVALDVDEQTGWKVSTVFLALDHSFGFGKPILYETMVFGGPLDQEQDRYYTRDEALAGHKAMCARVRRWVTGEAGS